MSEKKFDRAAFESLLHRRFFFGPSFSIYGGVAGLFDYGPPMCALQANFIDTWRKHFVLEEDMLEVDTTILTTHDVLKTSGHVDRFCDWMCKDIKSGDIYRADHLIENVLEARLEGDKMARTNEQRKENSPDGVQAKEKKTKKKAKVTAVKLDDAVKQEYEEVLAQIDNYGGKELAALIKKYDIRAIDTGNEVTEPVEFNLMFDTSIGPTGHVKG